jgi:acetyl-CoA/propionyl-CoA carboxylase biotin carboxyl carrier protein
VLEHPIFVAGEVGTTFVGDHMSELEAEMRSMFGAEPSGATAVAAARGEARSFEVTVNRRIFQVSVAEIRRERSEKQPRSRRHAAATAGTNAVASPMHGTVIAVRKSVGDAVQEGEAIFIVEAMKMENEILAHRSGTLTEISVQVGETVESGQKLAVIE